MSDEKVEESKITQREEKVNYHHKHKSVFMPVLFIVAFFMAICIAFGAGRHYPDRFEGPHVFGVSTRGGVMHDSISVSGPEVTVQGGMMESGFATRIDSDSNTTVSGVVTAINGNDITVAGEGITNTVSVNDHTTYDGDNKPARVNDSIFAIGARDSNNNLIASTVHLSRQ